VFEIKYKVVEMTAFFTRCRQPLPTGFLALPNRSKGGIPNRPMAQRGKGKREGEISGWDHVRLGEAKMAGRRTGWQWQCQTSPVAPEHEGSGTSRLTAIA
jgi:hypothetical protein